MTSVDSNFNFLCGRPHGAWPRPHASTWAWPLPPPCGRHKWMAFRCRRLYTACTNCANISCSLLFL